MKYLLIVLLVFSVNAEDEPEYGKVNPEGEVKTFEDVEKQALFKRLLELKYHAQSYIDDGGDESKDWYDEFKAIANAKNVTKVQSLEGKDSLNRTKADQEVVARNERRTRRNSNKTWAKSLDLNNLTQAQKDNALKRLIRQVLMSD